MKSLYVSTCPDTGRVFLCEAGKDNNLAEVFSSEEIAMQLCHKVNNFTKALKALQRIDAMEWATNGPQISDLIKELEEVTCTK